MIYQYEDFTHQQLIRNALLILEHLAKKYPKKRYIKVLFRLIVEMMIREVKDVTLKESL
jgi:hypothetical protein